MPIAMIRTNVDWTRMFSMFSLVRYDEFSI